MLPAAYRPSLMREPISGDVDRIDLRPLTVSNESPAGLVRSPGNVSNRSKTLFPTNGRFSILSGDNTSPTEAEDSFKMESDETETSTV